MVVFTSNRRGLNREYAIYYFFCNFLNLLNIVGNITVLCYFLGPWYLTYGWDYFAYTLGFSKYNISKDVFPKTSECSIKRFGANGERSDLHTVCILSLNGIIELIYLFLWWAFAFITIVNVLNQMYCIGQVVIPCLRRRAVIPKHNLTDKRYITFVRKMPLGDWLLLMLIKSNLYDAIYVNFWGNYVDMVAPTKPCGCELAPICPHEQAITINVAAEKDKMV